MIHWQMMNLMAILSHLDMVEPPDPDRGQNPFCPGNGYFGRFEAILEPLPSILRGSPEIRPKHQGSFFCRFCGDYAPFRGDYGPFRGIYAQKKGGRNPPLE